MEFTFKGKKSEDFGLHVQKTPAFSTAQRRTIVRDPEGSDFKDIKDIGSLSYILHLDMVLENATHKEIDKVKQWLQGRGWFTRSDYPNKQLLVEFQSSLQITYIADGIYRVYSTVFVVDPKWYGDDGTHTILGPRIENVGTAPSSPTIKLLKELDDKVDMTIGDSRFTYDFKGDDHVYIDTKEGEAYYESGRDNKIPMSARRMAGPWKISGPVRETGRAPAYAKNEMRNLLLNSSFAKDTVGWLTEPEIKITTTQGEYTTLERTDYTRESRLFFRHNRFDAAMKYQLIAGKEYTFKSEIYIESISAMDNSSIIMRIYNKDGTFKDYGGYFLKGLETGKWLRFVNDFVPDSTANFENPQIQCAVAMSAYTDAKKTPLRIRIRNFEFGLKSERTTQWTPAWEDLEDGQKYLDYQMNEDGGYVFTEHAPEHAIFPNYQRNYIRNYDFSNGMWYWNGLTNTQKVVYDEELGMNVMEVENRDFTQDFWRGATQVIGNNRMGFTKEDWVYGSVWFKVIDKDAFDRDMRMELFERSKGARQPFYDGVNPNPGVSIPLSKIKAGAYDEWTQVTFKHRIWHRTTDDLEFRLHLVRSGVARIGKMQIGFDGPFGTGSDLSWADMEDRAKPATAVYSRNKKYWSKYELGLYNLTYQSPYELKITLRNIGKKNFQFAFLSGGTTQTPVPIGELSFPKLSGNIGSSTDNSIRFIAGDTSDEIDFIAYSPVLTQKTEENPVRLNKNDNLTIGYHYPTLKPGDNKVVFNQGECGIEVTDKDRWY